MSSIFSERDVVNSRSRSLYAIACLAMFLCRLVP